MEGYLLERPVISYMPVSSEQSEDNLPNKLSHRVYSYEDLVDAAGKYTSGVLQANQTAELDALIEPYIMNKPSQTASDEIAERVDEYLSTASLNGNGVLNKLLGWGLAKGRSIKKRIDQANPRHKSNIAFDYHRFPVITLETVQGGVGRFGTLLNRFETVRASEIRQNVFLISP